MFPIWKLVTVHVPEAFTVLKEVFPGERLAIPLLPRGGGGTLVIRHGSSHLGGEHEPPGSLPVPDHIKVAYAGPDCRGPVGPHRENLVLLLPALAEVRATHCHTGGQCTE